MTDDQDIPEGADLDDTPDADDYTPPGEYAGIQDDEATEPDEEG